MNFDIDILVKNQRQYILGNLPYWKERYPDTVEYTRQLFPVEKIEQSLDLFVKDTFS